MTKSILAAMTAVTLGTVSSLSAATIDPSDYDAIYTEGTQTMTLDGADISGNAAIAGNGDVGTFTLPGISGATDILIAGRVAKTGRDQFRAAGVSGKIGINILAYGNDPTGGTGNFSSTFSVLVNGTIIDSLTLSGTGSDNLSASFNVFLADSDNVVLRVKSATGKSVYNAALNVTPVPLAASLPLLLTGAGALTIAGRRRKKA